MAKQTLPTNFKDDVLNTSMGGKRKWNITQNSDGTYSITDVTDYSQVGSEFGAGELNATNQAVNESADASKIIDDPDTAAATTEQGYIADVQLFNHLTESLGGVSFGVDTNGNRGYYDANGEFVNFSDGDGGLIIGVADITSGMKNTGKGFIITGKTAITLSKEYDLSKYKYIQLIYNDYAYYTRTWGVGYTKTPNDSYSNCMATSNKATVSANGNSQNTRTTKTIYFDISNVNEKGYPFVYYTSEQYSHILKLQLVNELEEI